MTRNQFLAWGRQWHYPFLIIAPDQFLWHGEESYNAATPAQIRLAEARIAQWNALVMSEQVEQAIGIVDELLKTRSSDEKVSEVCQ